MSKIDLRAHYNRIAFNEVFGTSEDPGAYVRFKSNSVRNVHIYNGSTHRNPAQPCRADFCCDVDNILSVIITEKSFLTKFFRHYIMGTGELTHNQQNFLEQKIGHLLRKHGVSPVNKYFRVIRRKNGR